tara:strand:- start:8235 stop:8894 length:660 start_codon:yes stop_codon:yes gene_type:complete
MKIIDVENIDEAVSATNNVLDEIFHQKVVNSIVFTGGRFGESIVSSFNPKYITKNIQIFQTDERFVGYHDEACIQTKLERSLFDSGINLESDQLNFFRLETTYSESIHSMKDLLDQKQIEVFDIVFLSLGEDGHLAGDFNTSDICIDNQICFTKNANKPPKKRISYTASWLLNSDFIFLAVIGGDKEKAFDDLIHGKGIHSSKINYDKNIIVLKDRNFK